MRSGSVEHDRVGVSGGDQVGGVDAGRGRRTPWAAGRRRRACASTRDRRTPGRAAVGVGVEAHHHVRQPHRAEEGRQDQRVRQVRSRGATPQRLDPVGGVQAVCSVDAVAVPDQPAARTAGISSAVSLSQYWNACTSVMLRMPPATTLTSTTERDHDGARPTSARRSARAQGEARRPGTAGPGRARRSGTTSQLATRRAGAGLEPELGEVGQRVGAASGAAVPPRTPAASGSRRSTRPGTTACRRHVPAPARRRRGTSAAERYSPPMAEAFTNGPTLPRGDVEVAGGARDPQPERRRSPASSNGRPRRPRAAAATRRSWPVGSVRRDRRTPRSLRSARRT